MCMIMLKSKNKESKNKKQCYISVPSQIITPSSLQSLLLSPKKAPKSSSFKIFKNPRFYFSFIFLFGLVEIFKMWGNLDPLVPFAAHPCSISSGVLFSHQESSVLGGNFVSQLSVRPTVEESDQEMSEFWKKGDGLGYGSCLDFSKEYEKESSGILKNRKSYLVVVVAGGINQQRNQIVDAVVIARILGAALVVPILQVNVIWGDERSVILSKKVICVFGKSLVRIIWTFNLLRKTF